ncbi:MAG: threonine synthase [Planctomycetes bacterium]|nr:threonine synthase [Planctomycetota bacterium]
MKLVGTRSIEDRSSFLAAAAGSTPEHGGLFVPERWPRFEDADALLALPWVERCARILERLIGDELALADVRAVVGEALDFPAPLAPLADGTFALELFHGPTLAFKDFGARFLAAVLERVPARGPRTILTATSGDTGAAVASAFWKRRGVRVVVLYPAGRIAPLQERQLACLGENVTAVAVAGTFDDCQALVKRCFADRALVARHGLASANSINLARVLAQVLYYWEAVAALRARGVSATPVVAVPSGNFGNLCAGLYAREQGLPVRAFVAATNANDVVPRFLDTGRYEPRATVPTLSNAMDVGAPSNWERIERLFGGDRERMRSVLRSGSATDEQTEDELVRMARLDYRACPHTAVAHRVLRERLAPGETGVFLATAHAAKFGDAIDGPLARAGFAPTPLPVALARLLGRRIERVELANDLDALVAVLDR